MGQIVIKTNYQRIAMKNKNGYVSRAVRFSKIDTDELVKHASDDSGVSEAMVSASFYAIVKQIEQLLLNGHSIQLGRIGTLRFSVKCKSVDNAEDVSTDNVKSRRILLTPSSHLKMLMRQVKLVGETEATNDEQNQEG